LKVSSARGIQSESSMAITPWGASMAAGDCR
jgi:hypothetical protein